MSLVKQIAALQDFKEYEDLHWEGSFEDYLLLVRKNPRVTRNSFQRVYDIKERVLPQWQLFSATIYAAIPTRKHVPARTRAFVDYLIQTFGGKDEDPWLLAAGCATRR